MAAQKAKVPNARTERCFPFNVKSTKIRMKLPQLRVFYVSVVLGLALFCAVNASRYSLVYVLYGHDLNKCSSSQDPINTLEPSTEQDLATNFTEIINSSFEIEQIPPKTVEDESKKAQEKLESADKAQQTDQKPSTPPPIATFEEWTKEKLMHKDKKKRQQNGTDKRNDQINVKINESAKNVEEKSEHPEKPKSEESPKPEDKLTTTEKKVETTTNPPVLPVIQPKRNYASKECGAKVIHANEEAEHVKAVLNDRERDEYARNPCEKAKNKFIIIELCETIQPTLLEIANFELFSSGPREIQLSIAERYPTMEWHSVGIFVAEDTREMQSFNFESPGIYAKFVKLDLLSHYGREHYCTLSTIRLSGISMVDEYEAEAISEQVQTETPEREENLDESAVKSAPEEPEKKEDVVEEKEKTVEVPVIGKVVETLGKLGSVIIGRQELKDADLWDEKEKRIIRNRPCFDQSNIRKSMENTTNYMCFLFGVRSKPHSSNSTGKSPRKPVKKPKMTKTCPNPAQRALLRAILSSKICPTAMNKPPEAVKELYIVVDEKNEPEVAIPEPEYQKKEEKVEEVQATPTSTTVAPPHASPAAPPPHQTQQNLANQQAQQQFAKNLNSLPGTASTHKESVFMKLNKRLSALELNISLSTEYLNELSRRYVAHQEEYNKQRERDQEFLKELVQQASQHMKMAYETQISDIKRDLDEITRKMRTISREYRQFDSFCQKAYSNFANFGPFERSLSVPEQSCVKREEEKNNLRMLTETKEDENGIDINSKVMEIETEFVDGDGTWSNMEVIAFVFLIQSLTVGVAILLVVVYTRAYVKEPFLPSKEPTPAPMERATSPSIDEIRRLVREELRRTPVTVPRLEENNRRKLKRPSRFSECDAIEAAGVREALPSEPSNLTPLRRRRSTIQPAEVGSEEELMEMRGSTPSIVDSSLAGTSISSRRSSTDSMMEKNSSPEQQKVTSPPWLTVRNPKFRPKKRSNKKDV